MILVDFNMISVMSLMSWYTRNQAQVLNISTAASVINDNLTIYKSRFSTFGQMVLCCDSKSYWRKTHFPYYKVKRKQARAATAKSVSNVDWNIIHGGMDYLKSMNLYHIVEVDGAEGDDVIAVLTKYFANKEDILILSSDKDFVQLQSLNTNGRTRVTQFNPQFNRYISVSDPVAFTREHIIRGDSGDSIPNFLSPDDTIISGQRNRSINTMKLQEWVMKDDFMAFCDTPNKVDNYKRNRTLIDFDYIPTSIQDDILTHFYGKQP